MILDVRDGNRVVGTCHIEREGLYYLVDISCDVPDGGIRRLVAQTDREDVPLGIPVPSEKGFILCTKKPCKMFGTGILGISFRTEGDKSKRFVPVSEHKPFEGICELENGIFQRNGECAGILLEDQP